MRTRRPESFTVSLLSCFVVSQVVGGGFPCPWRWRLYEMGAGFGGRGADQHFLYRGPAQHGVPGHRLQQARGENL